MEFVGKGDGILFQSPDLTEGAEQPSPLRKVSVCEEVSSLQIAKYPVAFRDSREFRSEVSGVYACLLERLSRCPLRSR